MTTTPLDLDPLTLPVHLRRELIDQGWNDKAIGRLLRDGSWQRLRHGAYVETAAFRALDDAGRHLVTTRCVLKQAQTETLVSHSSGAVLRGAATWGLPLDEVDLTRVDGRRGRREAGVRQHGGLLLPEDRAVVSGIPTTSATRVALEVTTQLDVEPAVGVVSHLLHTKQTTPELLAQRHDAPEGSLVHWPGTRANHVVLKLADERFESIGEVRAFCVMWRHGLPLPELQYKVFYGSGRLVTILDFAWPELGVFGEFDGRVKYEKYLRPGERASDVVVREKQREDLVRSITNWRGVRMVWHELDDSARLAARIHAVLVSR